jgi:hypothetical protein
MAERSPKPNFRQTFSITQNSDTMKSHIPKLSLKNNKVGPSHQTIKQHERGRKCKKQINVTKTKLQSNTRKIENTFCQNGYRQKKTWIVVYLTKHNKRIKKEKQPPIHWKKEPKTTNSKNNSVSRALSSLVSEIRITGRWRICKNM